MKKFILAFFFALALPLSIGYWQRFFAEGWWHLSYADLFNIAHYTPSFIIAGIAALIAVFVPFPADTKTYYWVRTAVRYRLAIAMLAYGFIKLFPLLAPWPSISNLNTNYGDFTRWKLFS